MVLDSELIYHEEQKSQDWMLSPWYFTATPQWSPTLFLKAWGEPHTSVSVNKVPARRGSAHALPTRDDIVKCSRRQVQVPLGTSRTAISNNDCRAFVAYADHDPLPTETVIIGVTALRIFGPGVQVSVVRLVNQTIIKSQGHLTTVTVHQSGAGGHLHVS